MRHSKNIFAKNSFFAKKTIFAGLLRAVSGVFAYFCRVKSRLCKSIDLDCIFMNNRGSFIDAIPPVTRHLLIINVLMWLATLVMNHTGKFDMVGNLGLHFWLAPDFNPVQLFTYMFLHDPSNFTHVFFNMFSLWMFGVTLERVLGPKRFLFYYVSCGLGAALVQELTWQFTWHDTMVQALAAANKVTPAEVIAAINAGHVAPGLVEEFQNSMITIGASGAVFGILLAFGMIFPNLKMYIIPFPFPIKAKWMVIGYGLVELFFGLHGVMAGVAHFAHLGGMVAGFFIILYWKHSRTIGGDHGYY